MLKIKKGFISNYLLFMVSFFFAPVAFSDNLIFTYWEQAKEPFAIRSGAKLTGGIVKDIGDELALRMLLLPKYIELPTKRVSIMVTSGEAHASCLSNPKWENNPANYHWSPILFKGSDNFLVRKGQEETIASIEDLQGKRIGTYNGYVYSEQIMSLFEQGKAESVQINDLDVGMKLVEIGRLDTVIDFGSIIEYEIKNKGLEDKLAISSMVADSFDLYCSFSLKAPFDVSKLDEHLTEMKQEGFFERILDKYR